MTIVFGIFLILHALVHLLYAGQVLRFFQLRPGLVWPDGSWLFSRLIGDPPARWLAAVSLTMAALGFLVAAPGLFFGGGGCAPCPSPPSTPPAPQPSPSPSSCSS